MTFSDLESERPDIAGALVHAFGGRGAADTAFQLCWGKLTPELERLCAHVDLARRSGNYALASEHMLAGVPVTQDVIDHHLATSKGGFRSMILARKAAN